MGVRDMQKVRKAVIPAAGFGTRFLPQTKAMPKQMLPIVHKPIIQYVVEELVSAGIEDIIIVTNHLERSIEDHFDDPNQDVVGALRMGGPKKEPLLKELEDIGRMANFAYVRQKGPIGNGTPFLNVRHIIGNEPFVVVWSDEFVISRPTSVIRQLIDTYNEFGCSVLGTVKADKEKDFDRYGYAGGTEIRPGLYDVNEIIEKPGKERVPASMAALIWACVYTPDIFDYMKEVLVNLPNGEELCYVDAVHRMYKDNKRVIAKIFENAEYYDCGTVLEYMKTATRLGLADPEIGESYKTFLQSLTLK